MFYYLINNIDVKTNFFVIIFLKKLFEKFIKFKLKENI